ncbi:MAG: hypothetical protein GWM92_18315 [Gemmatimonadetes bacterium]|nr:hypothetical protein [Gemmatimonadota bacterium]NIR80756.1 hypothetical protein [Gemmatimonadota bacterium]NIT89561.1 hypothetical protein [Gemmatimonadota bacterium]NIU33356.1 hypothetical protein [Gemmatimonadota bacterium]NIU37639.1 hypothetical protein [Gemmatimonadota bacterium]
MPRCRWLAVALAMPFLPSCFVYAPVTTERVEVGMPVRVDLTTEGTRRLEDEIGHTLESVEGTVVRKDGASWVVSSPLPSNPDAYIRRDLETRITVQVQEMNGVGARRLDPLRSALLGGVVAAAAVAALALIFEDDPGGEGEPPPGPTGPGEGAVIPSPSALPPGLTIPVGGAGPGG